MDSYREESDIDLHMDVGDEKHNPVEMQPQTPASDWHPESLNFNPVYQSKVVSTPASNTTVPAVICYPKAHFRKSLAEAPEMVNHPGQRPPVSYLMGNKYSQQQQDMQCPGRNLKHKYKCGCCGKLFEAICILHAHLKEHGGEGSYHYDHHTRTAFPKFESVCCSVQTCENSDFSEGDDIVMSKSSKEESHSELLLEENILIKTEADSFEYDNSDEQCQDKDSDGNTNFETEKGDLGSFVNRNDCQDQIQENTQLSNDEKKASNKVEPKASYRKIRVLTLDEAMSKGCRKGKRRKVKEKAKTYTVDQEGSSDSDGLERTSYKSLDKQTSKRKDCTQVKKTGDFICYECRVVFKSDDYSTNHKLRHDGSFPCDFCFQVFISSTSLLNHVCKKGVHRQVKNIKMFHCEKCDLNTIETEGLKAHICVPEENFCDRRWIIRSYSKMSDAEYAFLPQDGQMLVDEPREKNLKCNTCDQTFSNPCLLQGHILMHDFTYKCAKCNVYFSTDGDRSEHENICRGDKMLQCNMCPKNFDSKFSLNAHVSAHKGTRRYQCEKCGQAFMRLGYLNKHAEFCLNPEGRVKKYQCDLCPKKFYDNHTLSGHKLYVHTDVRAYICEVCGNTFKYANALRKHARQHMPERPQYKCDICNATFLAIECLRRHKKGHTQDQFTENCSFCGKVFRERWNLKAHMRQHTGEKPYVCEVCGQGFTHNVSRKTHLRNHHGMSV